MVQWLVTLFLRNFYYPNFASFLPLPTPFRRKVSRSPDWSYTSDPSDSTSQSAGITGVRYFRPPARSAYGLTAGRPWTCAETLHQDNWDVGRAGNRQGHRSDLGGWPAQPRSRERPQGLPQDRGRRFPGEGGGPAGKKTSFRMPPRPHPAATPASSLPAPARRPSDTRAGRGGAAKVPGSPQRPAPPRRSSRAAPSSPHPPRRRRRRRRRRF
eukprot:XP_017453313.1 PREDICTED: serine/arginine repetitive matrix protein 1-like [Rattus norvegicus]